MLTSPLNNFNPLLFPRMREDLQDQSENPLIDPMGECTTQLLNLVLFGRATPYLHNGSMMIEDDNGIVSSIF